MADFSYKEDIIATRKGGFGSSDAKMILKLSEGGELNAEDRKRIAEMLGLKEHEDFTSWEIQRGNEYEQYAFDAMLMAFPQAISNPFYISENMSNSFGFSIFNHIDMEVETETEITWYEMKTSRKEVADVIRDYNPQFAWHWMLLSEKAAAIGKKPKLILLYHPMDMLFDIDLLRTIEIASIPNHFIAGLERMKEILKTFEWNPSQDPMDLIPSAMAEGLRLLDGKLNELKALEAFVEKERETLLENMEKYCVPKGITSLPTGTHTIIYTSASKKPVDTIKWDEIKAAYPEQVAKFTKQVMVEQFDAEAFQSACPEIISEHTETTYKTRKASIQIRDKK